MRTRTNNPSLSIAAPAWWGGRQPTRIAAPNVEDDDSDYVHAEDWVDYQEEEWYKYAECEVLDHGYGKWFVHGKWRQGDLLVRKYDGNLPLDYEPGEQGCVRFNVHEYEGLPPETYTLYEEENLLQNCFGDKLKCRKLKYMY